MKGANLSNIRMKNCRIAGGGKVGMLVGNINQSTVTGCSVVDSTLTDIENGQQLYAGGLIGYAATTSIQSCYTRNLTIEITNTVTVRAIGGLVAYQAAVLCRTATPTAPSRPPVTTSAGWWAR